MSDSVQKVKAALKWWMDDNGDESAGRIAFLPAVWVGLGIATIGTLLSVYEVVAGTKTSVGPLVISAGGVIVGAAFAFKGWQRKSEAKIYEIDKNNGGVAQ